MTEDDYWVHLEYRVCDELEGIEEHRRRGLWCDGFIPRDYALDDHPPQIRGRVWICDREHQWEWDFTLLLERSVPNRESTLWQAQLPADDVTRWLRLDFDLRHVRIAPRSAVRGTQA